MYLAIMPHPTVECAVTVGEIVHRQMNDGKDKWLCKASNGCYFDLRGAMLHIHIKLKEGNSVYLPNVRQEREVMREDFMVQVGKNGVL